MIDFGKLRQDVESTWKNSIVERLQAYVRIPNKSPAFDPDWEKHGYMDQAITLMADWCRAQNVPGARVEVRKLPGRTPVLLVDIPGEKPDCVLLYGHLDKQPEFTGWLAGLGPWEPVIRDGKLYGRGGADDGYAVFSSLAAIAALKRQKIPLARCVILIEASEESGSPDLPAHLDALGSELGTPSLVVCLDAECGNFDQLWCTTSLRGNLVGELTVRVLTDGAHSGLASGIAATPFRIAQQLLARMEDPVTGENLLPELRVEVPPDRRAQAKVAAKVLGDKLLSKVPFAKGVQPLTLDREELLLNNTWRPSLCVTGADGFPASAGAGNVLLPFLKLKLSIRLPPGADGERALTAVRNALESNPPYGAQISFRAEAPTRGWNAPAFAPWLEDSMTRASQAVFGGEPVHLGGGGSIPFMTMLGERFPSTQFFITGVLGPLSNAHGPNEFLHIDYATKLTDCVARVLADHATQ